MDEGLPASDVERVRRFCADKIPKARRAEHRLDVVVADGGIEIHEARMILFGAPASWTTMPLARFTSEHDGTYTLSSGSSDGTWDPYLDLEAHQILEVLIEEVEQDPTGVFWG